MPDCAGDLFTTSDQTLPSTLWTFVPLAQVIYFAVFCCSLFHLICTWEIWLLRVEAGTNTVMFPSAGQCLHFRAIFCPELCLSAGIMVRILNSFI